MSCPIMCFRAAKNSEVWSRLLLRFFRGHFERNRICGMCVRTDVQRNCPTIHASEGLTQARPNIAAPTTSMKAASLEMGIVV